MKQRRINKGLDKVKENYTELEENQEWMAKWVKVQALVKGKLFRKYTLPYLKI
jgi:hypothetical protein